jgi:hypothetical protein
VFGNRKFYLIRWERIEFSMDLSCLSNWFYSTKNKLWACGFTHLDGMRGANFGLVPQANLVSQPSPSCLRTSPGFRLSLWLSVRLSLWLSAWVLFFTFLYRASNIIHHKVEHDISELDLKPCPRDQRIPVTMHPKSNVLSQQLKIGGWMHPLLPCGCMCVIHNTRWNSWK